MKSLVSVIIPVYRAAQTLPQCLAELRAQTYRALQVIFVDDCSPDASAEIIQQGSPALRDLGMEVILLRHAENQGVAVARNTALNAATGTYIYSLDADDRLHPQAIERLVQTAEATGAPIVGCEYYLEQGATSRVISQPDVQTGREAFRQICLGRMKWNLWLFLIERELLESPRLRFLPGQNMGEDLMLMSRLLQRTERIAILHESLYTYVRSEAQLTGTYRPEHWLQVAQNVRAIEDHLPELAPEDLAALKLTLKLPLLVTGEKADYQRWRELYPEADAYATRIPSQPARTRLLQWMAAHGQYWYVSLYTRVVMQMLYRLRYR